MTGGELLTLVGAGHLPMAREPVAVNRAIGAFLDRLEHRPVRRRFACRRGGRSGCSTCPRRSGWATAGATSPSPRSCGGRGPDVRVDWLAQPPLTDWLRQRGETVHPASAFLASEAAHIDGLAGEHDLHAFQAIREMDEILVANFMLFTEIAEQEHFDLWVGDEAWELDHFLHENPELKTTAFAWMTDFVGWLPMTGDGREADAHRRLQRRDARARRPAAPHPRPGDLRGRPAGRRPRRRSGRAARHPGLDDGALRLRRLRHRASTRPRSPTGRRCASRRASATSRCASSPSAAAGSAGTCCAGRWRPTRCCASGVPGMRMVVVTGPRIDPASLAAPPGVEVRGWVPDLHRLLAAADVALVQGGLTTTMELTAAGRPFVYVPLQHHFEQNIHVRHRLAQYGAGRCVPWTEASAGAAGRRAGRAGRHRARRRARSSPAAPPAPRPCSPTCSRSFGPKSSARRPGRGRRSGRGSGRPRARRA